MAYNNLSTEYIIFYIEIRISTFRKSQNIVRKPDEPIKNFLNKSINNWEKSGK